MKKMTIFLTISLLSMLFLTIDVVAKDFDVMLGEKWGAEKKAVRARNSKAVGPKSNEKNQFANVGKKYGSKESYEVFFFEKDKLNEIRQVFYFDDIEKYEDFINLIHTKINDKYKFRTIIPYNEEGSKSLLSMLIYQDFDSTVGIIKNIKEKSFAIKAIKNDEDLSFLIDNNAKKPVVRGKYWGESIAHVIQDEVNNFKPYKVPSSWYIFEHNLVSDITFERKVFNVPCEISYTFIDDRLFKVSFSFSGMERDNQKAEEFFFKLKEILSEKYSAFKNSTVDRGFYRKIEIEGKSRVPIDNPISISHLGEDSYIKLSQSYAGPYLEYEEIKSYNAAQKRKKARDEREKEKYNNEKNQF